MDVGQVLPSTKLLAEDMFIEVDLGYNIPVTTTLAIREQELMLKGEVDIGLQLGTINPITKVNMVYC